MIHCPVCQTPAELAYRHPAALIYRCPRCTHCFSDVRSIKHTEEYDRSYYEQTHRNWNENPDVETFRILAEHIVRQNRRASVFDVGCGTGHFLGYLAESRPTLELTGIDPSTRPEIAGVEIVNDDFLAWDPPRTFDVIVSLHVIEHIEDVHAFVRRIVKLCKPGGSVIISTINEGSILYMAARLLRRVGLPQPFVRLYGTHHLHHFTPASLRWLLESEGVAVQRAQTRNLPMACVDTGADCFIADGLYRLGVGACFALGAFSGRSYQQILFCSVSGEAGKATAGEERD